MSAVGDILDAMVTDLTAALPSSYTVAKGQLGPQPTLPAVLVWPESEIAATTRVATDRFELLVWWRAYTRSIDPSANLTTLLDAISTFRSVYRANRTWGGAAIDTAAQRVTYDVAPLGEDELLYAAFMALAVTFDYP